jgi:hypothetical protein
MTKAREAKKAVQCVDTYSEPYKDIGGVIDVVKDQREIEGFVPLFSLFV